MRLGQTSLIHFLSHSFAAALSFVALIYFARILGEEAIGNYYLVIAVVSWLKIGGRVGIAEALVKRISEGKEQEEYLTAAITLVALLFSVMIAGILILRGYFVSYTGIESISLIVLMLGAALSWSIVDAVLRGEHKVHLTGGLKPFETGTRSIAQLLLVVAGLEVVGLLIGYSVGWIIAGLLGVWYISTRISLPSREHFEQLFEFARYSWLGSLQGKMFNWTDVLVLGFFVGSGTVGIYSIAWTISYFLTKFSTAISSTLFPEISRLQEEGRKGEISGVITDGLSFTGLLLIPGLVGAVTVGDRLLRL